MHQPKNKYLIWSGIAAAAAAAAAGMLHVAAIFGGPTWYRMIGATKPIIEMVERGHSYPILVVLVVATILFACASYAFSGAGLMPRLPLLRTGLVVITTGLLIHGLAFLPAVVLWPKEMLIVYDGEGIDLPLIAINVLCLAAGIGYALGTRAAWQQLSLRQPRLKSG